MPAPAEPNFEALERKLAKDALEKTLKDLQVEVSSETKQKKYFSEEIKKSLSTFTESLGNQISKEIDQKFPLFLEKNFFTISEKVKESLE